MVVHMLQNNEWVSSPTIFQSEVPFTRFGYDNVSRKTIEVCSNSDSITLIGTSLWFLYYNSGYWQWWC